ncbi:SART-1 family protein DOT2 [Vitis vinifera]|uniref:SART-1 family protein DOT2 n=1 Tax=Vitis vinifera TaxID=29760 RepID=A0A438DC65_VITVI|nr:SART-1 family protein DOT2 [Vitis vinifera]
MDMDWSEPKPERSDELRDRDDSPTRDYHDGAYDDLEENGIEKSSKHRSKDRKKSRREEKDHRGKDRERSKAGDGLKEREKETKDSEKDRVTSRERRKEDRDEREKDRNRDKVREKDYDREKYRDKERERDKDRKDRGKEKEREREREVDKESDRGRDKERGKEKNRDRDKEREKERERAKDRDREKEKEKSKDREKERENDKDRDRDAIDKEKGKERIRDKEREADQDRDRDRDVTKQGRGSHHDEDDSRAIEHEKNAEGASGPQSSTAQLQERILRMKEERVKRKSEGSSEVLAWVNRSRKVEEQRNAEKEKALQLSKIFEEQDNIDQGESDDEKPTRHSSQDLAGVKVLHGLDKVIEGGAVVLTLKDQDILANGDINEDGEQKRRDEAYKAAKRKQGFMKISKSTCLFNDEPGSEKKILPQYDDPVTDEVKLFVVIGLALDASGRFTGEAEKKLEELRRRLQGVSTNNRFEDLNTYGKNSSDYYTHEEMLQFKKPKKKKSLRKKEKLNIDALEAEAVSAGLGVGDLGSRNDGKRRPSERSKKGLRLK